MSEITDETPATEAPAGIGQVFGGRYVAEGRIGTGGMAIVYVGRDRQLNRRVAIKVLRASASKDFDDDFQRLEARFQKEAESLARLNHRSIVTVYDYGTAEDGAYYLVMEYVDGASLARMLKGGQRMEPARAVRLGLQICKALRYAHRRGLIHRDVKLANILVTHTDEGEVAKLVDFGLVKLVDEEGPTQHGIILGSTNCMAPEQITGGFVDRRVDIYGLGVVLYRLLTGRYPFQSDSTAELLAAHLHAPVPRFAEIVPELALPDGLEAVIRRMLAKRPEDRFTNADQVLTKLAPLIDVPADDFITSSLHNQAVLTYPPPPPRVEQRRTWMWAVAAVPAVLLLLVLASAMGGLTVYWLGPGPAPATTAPATTAPVPPPEPAPIAAPAPAPEAPDPVAPPEPVQVTEPEPVAAPEPAPVAAPEPAPRRPRPAPKQGGNIQLER